MWALGESGWSDRPSKPSPQCWLLLVHLPSRCVLNNGDERGRESLELCSLLKVIRAVGAGWVPGTPMAGSLTSLIRPL